MTVSASVLLPEPFGPMIACTSPLRTVSSIPLRIGLPSTSTCRSRMTRSDTGALPRCGLRRALRGQVLQGHAVQGLRDLCLDGHPDVMRRASRLERAVHNGLALGGADLRLDRTLE